MKSLPYPTLQTGLLALILSLAQAVGAATVQAVGANFALSAGTSLDSAPAVAVNPEAGTFLVAWSRSDTASVVIGGETVTRNVTTVAARLVASDGSFLTDTITVTPTFDADTILGGNTPSVAYNTADNEFLVVYERSENQSQDPGIFARRIGAGGVPRGTEIALIRANSQTAPVVSYDANSNRYFVVWNGAGNVNTFGLLLTNAGVALGTVTQMGPIGQVTRSPALAFNGDAGRYLLALETSLASASDIVARLLDSNGLQVSDTVSVSAAAGAQTLPQVLPVGGQFLVAWNDGGTRLRAQLVNGDGSLAGGNRSLRNNAASPLIAYSKPRKRYLTAWIEAGAANANKGYLMGQFLPASLSGGSAVFKVSETATVSGRAAAAVYQRDNLGLVVWSRRISDTVSTIWGQFVDFSTQFATLSLNVKATPKTVSAGAELTYVMTVQNKGGNAAKGVSLADALPEGATLLSATPSTGSCTPVDAVVNCDLGTLAGGSSATVELVVVPSRLGTSKNQAQLDWSNNPGGSLQVNTKVKITYPGTLTLVAPDGGETLPAGSLYQVSWDLQGGVPGDVVSYRLDYSLNGGTSWKKIASGLPETTYPWRVPAVTGNQSKSLLRVTGFNQDGLEIGSARSAKPFTIQVISLKTPVGGEAVNSGHVLNIIWETFATKGTVRKVELAYSLNGGKAWKKLANLQGNPGSYAWTAPALTKTYGKSKVRVLLKGASGKVLGSVVSPNFTLLP